eukprot:9092655-Karenia_brevis.AAC.1
MVTKLMSRSFDFSKYVDSSAPLRQVVVGLAREGIEVPATQSHVTTSILQMFSASMGGSGMRRRPPQALTSS